MTRDKLKRNILEILGNFNFSLSELELILVRIRLYLEYTKQKKNYPQLNFYCDWNLHTEINRPDKIVDLILELNEKIFVDYDLNGKMNVHKLIDPDKFKDELNLFIIKELNSIKISLNGEIWNTFFRLLCELLSNRPLKIPENYPKKYKDKVEKIDSYSTSRGVKIGIVSFELEFTDGNDSNYPKGTIIWKAKNRDRITFLGKL